MSSVFGSGDTGKKPVEMEGTLQTQKKDLKIATGIPGFDESLGSALPAGNIYLIAGELGASTNLFVQQVMHSTMISRGRVAYYTIEATSTDVIADMEVHGLHIQQYVDDGSWLFARIVPPNMKEIVDALPEVPMEQRIDLDESFTKLMNHFYDTVKDGRNTVIHLPLLIHNYSMHDIQNLLFYMKGIARRHGGIHFLLLTEGAHDKNIVVSIKDSVDAVFDIATTPRGTEVENVVTISKIRGIIPKVRIIRLSSRDGKLATETIRRVQ